MRLCLVRHGETDWNKEKRLQGRTDIALNDNGRFHATKAGEYLKQYTWDRIITSPLLRAKETAEIISRVLDINEVSIDDNVIERNYGLAEGLTLDERLEKYPDRNYEGMEEREILRARMMKALEGYAGEYKDENIIVVSHGGAINSVLHTLSDGEYGSGITTLHMGSLSMLKYNCKFEIDRYNIKSY